MEMKNNPEEKSHIEAAGHAAPHRLIEGKGTIQQVAKLLNISTDAIRLYEKEGLITPERDPSNGYRYYDAEKVHRVIAINLYRKMDFSISSISNILNIGSLSEISAQFLLMQQETERKIQQLKEKAGKLEIMRHHLDLLEKTENKISVRIMPDMHVIWEDDGMALDSKKYTNVFHSPLYPFGHFNYIVKQKQGRYAAVKTRFIVRTYMMDVCPARDDFQKYPIVSGCKCLYSVARIPANLAIECDLSELQKYAAENNMVCSNEAYIYYVFTLHNGDNPLDYYEVYLPVTEK